MAQNVDFNLRADISNLKAELAKIPGLTDKEAKAMVRNLDRQLKAAEKASKSATTQMTKGWSKAGGELKTFQGQARNTEGVIRGLARGVGSVSPELEGMMRVGSDAAASLQAVARSGKGLAAVLGPVTAVVVAGAAAYAHLSSELEKAEERMDDAADAADKMMKVHQMVADAELTLALAAGQMGQAEYDAAITTRKAEDVFKARIDTLKGEKQAIRDTITELEERETQLIATTAATSGSMEMIGGSTLIHSGNTKALTENQTALKHARKELALNETQTDTASATQEKYAAILAETADLKRKNKTATKENTAAAKDHAAALESLAGIVETSAADQLSAAESLAVAAQNEIDTIDALEATYGQVAGVAEGAADARREVAMRLARDLTAIESEMQAEITAEATEAAKEREAAAIASLEAEEEALIANRAAHAEHVSDLQEGYQILGESMAEAAELAFGALSDMHAAAAEDILETADASVAAAEETLSAAEESGNAAAIAAAELELEKAKIAQDAAEKSAQTKMDAAVVAFRLEQSAAVASIAMSTAQAVMAAYTLGPVAGAAATAGLIALGATQAAVVLAQEPPSLHTGGVIGNDERLIKARVGEGVLTQQGVRNVGGVQGVTAANAGAASSQPMVIQHVYKHKALDTVVSDHLKKNTSLRAATSSSRPRGRTNPYNGSL